MRDEGAGAAIYARFDPPFTPWFLRRNEVWIEVEAPGPIGSPGEAGLDGPTQISTST